MREPCARRTTAVAAWSQPAVLLNALTRQPTQLAEARKRRAALRHALWRTAASRHDKHLYEPPLAGMHRQPRYGITAVFLKHRSTTAGDKNKYICQTTLVTQLRAPSEQRRERLAGRGGGLLVQAVPARVVRAGVWRPDRHALAGQQRTSEARRAEHSDEVACRRAK